MPTGHRVCMLTEDAPEKHPIIFPYTSIKIIVIFYKKVFHRYWKILKIITKVTARTAVA